MTLSAWKFMVPADRWYPLPDDSSREYKGLVIVVVSETLEAARVAARRYCAENAYDPSWLTIARIHKLDLVEGAVLTYVAV